MKKRSLVWLETVCQTTSHRVSDNGNTLLRCDVSLAELTEVIVNAFLGQEDTRVWSVCILREYFGLGLTESKITKYQSG
jgi:hypothetical protein